MRGRRSALALMAALVCAVAFSLGAWRERFLCDDAFISFRYARHLAAGQGLTWNRGERVEGYSDFLWVVLMAGASKAGIAPEVASQVLGAGAGAAVLGILAALAARRRTWASPWVWVAPLALALNRSFTAWATGGLETMFFTALLLAAFLAYTRERDEGREDAWLSAVLLALLGLTRPEGLLFAALLAAAYAFEVRRGGRSVGGLVRWVALWALPVAGHLFWRHWYYDSWLPNTFFAKVPGSSWRRGWEYLKLYHNAYHFGWFLPLAAAVVAMRRCRDLVLAGILSAAYLGYVVAVGGDRLEFRFLVPVLPWSYWLAAEGIAWVERRLGGSLRRWVPVPAVAVLGACGLIGTTLEASTHGRRLEGRRGTASLSVLRTYARDRMDDGRRLADLIRRGLLPADLTIAVGGAGAIPYYTDWSTVDRRGLNDARVVRWPLRPRGAPGHARTAPLADMRTRGVAVVDVFNDLVQRKPCGAFESSRTVGGRRLPIRAVHLEGPYYLVFGSLVPDPTLAAVFAGREILLEAPRCDTLPRTAHP